MRPPDQRTLTANVTKENLDLLELTDSSNQDLIKLISPQLAPQPSAQQFQPIAPKIPRHPVQQSYSVDAREKAQQIKKLMQLENEDQLSTHKLNNLSVRLQPIDIDSDSQDIRPIVQQAFKPAVKLDLQLAPKHHAKHKKNLTKSHTQEKTAETSPHAGAQLKDFSLSEISE